MTSREGRKLVSYELPEEALEALDVEKEKKGIPKWELIYNALKSHYGIEGSIPFYKRRLAELENAESSLIEERDEIIERLEAVREEQAEITAQLEAEQEAAQSYEDACEELLDHMHTTGTHIFTTHGKVETIATEYDKEPATVIEDLKSQTDLPDERFEQATGNEDAPALASTTGGGA